MKQYLILDKPISHATINKLIPSKWKVECIFKNSVKSSITFLDTFDFLLKRKNKYLIHQLGAAILINGEKRIQSTIHKSIDDYLKAEDILDEDLKAKLKAIIDLRALIPFYSVFEKRSYLKILNKDKKTVLHIQIMEFSRAEKPLFNIIELIPLKGYQKDKKNILDTFLVAGAKATEQTFYELLLNKYFSQTQIYSSKIEVKLNKKDPFEKSLKSILAELTNIFIANEDGIYDDIDIEFLHDYRVAIRKIRTLFSCFKKFSLDFPFIKWSPYFKKIAKSMNDLRDLDVYLLEKENFLRILPAEMQSDLDYFFLKLHRKRKKEYQKIKQFLISLSYRKFKDKWISFLDEPIKTFESPTTYNLVQKAIYKRYKLIIKKGAQLEANSPDEEFHSVRIQCKKLRYLMELFQSIFPKTEIQMLIKKVKNFQTNLGDFNDYCVQKEYLQTQLKSEKINQNHAACLGGLIVRLDQIRLDEKEKFSANFALFNTNDINEKFKHLFGEKK